MKSEILVVCFFADTILKIWKFWNSMFLHKPQRIHTTWKLIWQC